MNDLVGKWVRLKNNRIVRLHKIYTENSHYISIMTKDGVRYCMKGLITATADTPQELVQEGDCLLVDKNYVRVIKDEEGNIVIDAIVLNIVIDEEVKDNITEIWTRTNKDTYKRQWKKEESK